MKRSKTLVLNIACSLLLQVFTIISGLIIPRIIISIFGSEVNGMVTSINQFLNYITLLEGGVSSVIMASLYEPIEQNDISKINGIVKAANNFFKTIGIIYIVYVIILSFVYKFISKAEYSFGYVAALVFILALNLFIQYFFSLTYKVLLNASRKVYIVSLSQIIVLVVNLVVVLILSKIYPQIHIIKLGSALVFLLQPILYHHFIKKYYALDFSVEPDMDALSQRWDGFGQNLAFFIHTNTDVVLLTFFADLISVSIYSVYDLVAKGLKSLVISVSTAIVPSMGQILAKKDKAAIDSAMDLYIFGIGFVSTFFFICGIMLILPFITLYTKGITDIDYLNPTFSVLILIAEYIYCFRDPYVSVSYAAGHFKQTAKYAYIEAAMNILISICLIGKLGLVGVAIGTVTAMVYRMIFSVLYLKNNIIHRPLYKFIKSAAVFWITGAVLVFIWKYKVVFSPIGYIQWFGMAVLCAIIVFSVLCFVSLLFFKTDFLIIIDKLKGRKNS